MELNTSGSLDEVLSSLHFMKSGLVEIQNSETLEPDSSDFATLTMMQNFVTYAMDRDDWIMIYLEEINNHLENKKKDQKPKLRLIEGGKA